jgi:Flp pilus assembly protein TadD
VSYPASAPALRHGQRYAWELHTERQPVQRAEFEILTPSDAQRVQQGLGLLTPSALAGQPASTVALLRAGFLVREGLYQDARKELLAAIAVDASEPTLHQLLGHVYDRMGMKDLATDSFDEARFLSAPRP